jgi:Na+-transporting NADH:ubiquinone oxidoreductase subunit NqrD
VQIDDKQDQSSLEINIVQNAQSGLAERGFNVAEEVCDYMLRRSIVQYTVQFSTTLSSFFVSLWCTVAKYCE